MTKVFISYARENFESANKLYQDLKFVPDLEPWLDKECILPGMRWEPEIWKAVRESNYFIALLSKSSSSRRGYAHSELRRALEMARQFPDDQIFLIPVRLDECEMPVDELWGINYVDFFPNWDSGYRKVLGVMSQNKGGTKSEPIPKEVAELNTPYYYRVGIVDLFNGLINLTNIVQRLNLIQKYFHFTCPTLPSVDNAIYRIENKPYLLIQNISSSVYAEHQYLNVDLVACLSKYPLSFRENGEVLYNYFSGPSDIDSRFMFISTHLLYEFTKQAGCTFEKGIVYIIISQLVAHFTDWGYHQETKECVMDFCKNRYDIVKGLKSMMFCEYCVPMIKNPDLMNALQIMLRDEILV